MNHETNLHGSIENMPVLDIAIRNVISLTLDDFAGAAAQIMSERQVSSILVTDDAGSPMGIVTERNMLYAMQSGMGLDTELRDIMSAPLISVPTDISVLAAYRLCQEKNIRHLVIVDDRGGLAGIVSETDFRLHLHLGALAGRRKIASVARRSGISLPPTSSLSQALALMLAQHKSCVVVVEDRKPVGIITERDVVRFYSTHTSPGDMLLGEVMTRPVLTIHGDAPASESAELMLVSKVRHLVVVDDGGYMIGLLNEHDLTGMMTDGVEARGGLEANFLRLLVNTLPDLIWLKDKEGGYLACNARFEKFFGKKEKDIVGKSDYDFLSREVAAFFRGNDLRAMENNAPTTNEESIVFADDGHHELLETIKTPMRNREGELIGVLGIGRDITLRKQLEDNLERSERKLHDIYDSVGDCIEIISRDGSILDMNRIGYERLGFTREEMVGRKLHEFTPPEFSRGLAESMAQILRDGYATFESGRLRKDGSVMPLEVRSRMVQLDGQDVFLGISRDITMRKRTEDALRFIAQRNATENPESILTSIARYLGKTLEVDGVIIAQLVDEPDMAETVALYDKGSIAPNIRYALKDTPCDNVVGKVMCCYGHDVQKLFPKDRLMVAFGADSYAGMPLWDSSGRPIGLIAVLDSRPFADEKNVTNLLQLMAARSASELERAHNEQLLKEREQDLLRALQFSDGVINAIPDLLFELDRFGRYLNIWAHNPDLLTAQKELLLGRTVAEMLPTEAAAVVMSAIESAIANGTSNGQVVRLDLPQGRRWFELSTAAKPASDGIAWNVLMLSRDISARMEAEAQLYDSHAKLSGLYSLSPMGIALTDMQGRYVEFNDAFLKISGYTREELIKLDYWELTPKEYAEQEAAQLESLNGKGYYGPYEKEYIRKDGSRIPLRLNGVLIHDSDGQPYIWSIVEDITAQKQAEQRQLQDQALLREKNEFLDSVFESALDAVVLMDAKGICTRWNHQAEVIFGWRDEEAVGRYIHELIVPERYREAHRQGMSRFLTSGEGTMLNRRVEITAMRRDGSEFAAEISIAPIRTEKGYEFSSFIRDISERQLMERQVQESEELFRAVFTQAPSAVELIDPDTLRFIEANPAACAMLGYTREEYLQLRLTDTQSDLIDEASLRASVQQIEDLGGLVFENKHRCKNGDILLVEISARMINLSGRRLLVGVWRDITERKRAELQREHDLSLLNATLEASADAILVVAPDNKWSLYNQRFLDLWRIPSEIALSGDDAAALAYVIGCLEDPEVFLDKVKGLYATPEANSFDTINFKDGRIVERYSIPQRISGQVVGRVWSFRDVTEQKRAENALREREEIFSSIVNQAADSILLIDAESMGFVEFNRMAHESLGYTREEFARLSLADVQMEYRPESLRKILDDAMASRRPLLIETQHKRKDGSIRQTQVSSRAIEMRDKHYFSSIWSDISARKETELKLQQSEAHFRFVTESAQALIWMSDPTKLCTWFNKVWLDFTGRSMEQELGDGWMEGVFPDDLAQCREIYSRSFDRREAFSMEYRLRHRDGEYRWVVDSGKPRFNALGVFEGYIGSCFDITARKRDEDSLRITASVFDTTHEAILITDSKNFITDVNPAFTRITGYSRDEVLGRDPKILSSGRHDRNFYAEMWRIIKERKSWRGEIWNRRKSGETYTELLSISAITGADGKVQRYVGVFSDISYLKEHEAELSRIAHYDALTGIPNRVLLADRMKQAIAQTARDRSLMAVCYLDLDGFKPINDTLGHDAGDRVLVEVAKRIGRAIRGGDTVARLGGDEFVVLLLDIEREDECITTLERLLSVISQPMEINGTPVALGASIGVSIYPQDDENPDILLRHADQAMYVAKQSGKNRYHIFDSALDLRARNHNEFVQGIRTALEKSQFELFYQPQLALESGKVTGAEALLRWRHAERGLLLPADFLPVIENTELGIEIGNWVISEALAQLDRWRQGGLDIEIGINVSAYHLESPDFVQSLQRHLFRYPDIPPRCLQIEVLETAALNDMAVVRKHIEACRSLGVRFALDDFGTGYSSLSYLSNLPVDTLKIDQSFVRDMLHDSGDRAIVQGVIALARAFGGEAVAEGIESGEQYRLLLEMGCEKGQGYGIARPMPASELSSWRRS